nr:MAG TPA: hypothetical protein [Caudoviricetes sp.]
MLLSAYAILHSLNIMLRKQLMTSVFQGLCICAV